MKLSKQIPLILCSMLLCFGVYAQNVDYYATDTTHLTVKTFMKSDVFTRQEYIKIKDRRGVTTLTPNQITDYGFKDGTVYVSKEIEFEGKPIRVFLRRLEQGTISLYTYKTETKDFYYLEKDSTLTKLNSSDKIYQRQIRELTSDFNWSGKQVDLIKFSSRSLKKIVKRYNFYDNTPLPQFRKGVTAGLRLTNFTNPTFLPFSYSFTQGESIFIGAYAEMPLLQSPFSVLGGINLSKTGITGIQKEVGIETIVAINLTSIDIPLLLRYTLAYEKWASFVNIGTTFQTNLSANVSAIQTFFNGNVVNIFEIDQSDIIQNSLSGFTVGAGVKYPVNKSNLASAEVRYKSLNSSKGRISQNQFEVLVNYSF
ncbi:MAG: outer membrane beta-barrel protein [Bacteroidota bacterium]